MSAATHFARVQPIVGSSLSIQRVAVYGLPLAAPLVMHLAASGIERWRWVSAPINESRAIETALDEQHGPNLKLKIKTCALAALFQPEPSVELVIWVGRPPVFPAGKVPVPWLIVQPPDTYHPGRACMLLPGDSFPLPLDLAEDVPLRVDEWTTMAPFCAGLARALLLRNTSFCCSDLPQRWAAGQRVVDFGVADALSVSWSAAAEPRPVRRQRYRPPMPPPDQPLLIAGLGSLGSVAAEYLACRHRHFILADPDHVDVYNPVRQAFGVTDIGRPKAIALADRLASRFGCRCEVWPSALATADQVAAVIEQYNPGGALIVTGTAADYDIAHAFRQYKLPHVVGRCYPRARYWEAMLIDGADGPSLDDLRGHIHAGPAASPTPEQRAAYSNAGALEAEPATLIESGWAAAWLSRLLQALRLPPGLRPAWLLRALAIENPCFLGGMVVEEMADGPAYGINMPGQVRALGRRDIHLEAGER